MENDISHLLCDETLSFSEEGFVIPPEGEEEEEEDDQEMFDIAEEERFVQIMIEKEISFNFGNVVSNDQIKLVRSEAVSWILRSRNSSGLRTQTIYLSIAYFDRFVLQRTSRNEDIGDVTLVSAACLSLAAKMEETKAPRLEDYDLDYTNFESVHIGRMEFFVFKTLELRLILVTPFHYLHCFIYHFSGTSSISHDMVSTTEALILEIIEEVNFLSYRPSVVAAASTLMALDQNLTRNTLEARINSISSLGFLQIEQVFQCYNMIRNLRRDDDTTSKTGAIGTKRIRLL